MLLVLKSHMRFQVSQNAVERLLGYAYQAANGMEYLAAENVRIIMYFLGRFFFEIVYP